MTPIIMVVSSTGVLDGRMLGIPARPYQRISPLSLRNLPVGGSSIVASLTAMAAPCSTVRGAASVPRSVLTHPGEPS